jgi:hypothetical protein
MATFTDAVWGSLVKDLVSILGPGAEAYSGKRVARLVAAVPYLSGSEDPDRFALANLLTLHGATVARKVFDHRASDDADIYRRLACYKCGAQADQEIVKYGLALLALIMVSDYKKDAEADKQAGKYNPLNAGKWNADNLQSALVSELKSDWESAALYDPLMTPAQAMGAWWIT